MFLMKTNFSNLDKIKHWRVYLWLQKWWFFISRTRCDKLQVIHSLRGQSGEPSKIGQQIRSHAWRPLPKLPPSHCPDNIFITLGLLVAYWLLLLPSASLFRVPWRHHLRAVVAPLLPSARLSPSKNDLFWPENPPIGLKNPLSVWPCGSLTACKHNFNLAMLLAKTLLIVSSRPFYALVSYFY